MRIIISPAKQMREDRDTLPPRGLPGFLPETGRLLSALRNLSPAELQKLWKCSDAIAALNVERLRTMDLERGLTPALLSYVGIQYQTMAARVLETSQYEFLQEHLRILSGFYGLLRPFDGVTPYRLEMGARLAVDGCRDLYAFWGISWPGPWRGRAAGCWTWPPRSTAGRSFPTCPPRCGWSPAYSGSRAPTARWWRRGPCAKWPGARWSGGWRRRGQPTPTACPPFRGWGTGMTRTAPPGRGWFF